MLFVAREMFTALLVSGRALRTCESNSAFIFSYDVVFAADAQNILKKFLDFEANMVFSAEDFCWPDKSLAVSNALWHRPSEEAFRG